MGAEESPEGREIVQELEPVDVLLHDQGVVGHIAAQENGKDLQQISLSEMQTRL